MTLPLSQKIAIKAANRQQGRLWDFQHLYDFPYTLMQLP
jgi:hypothetical protein